MGSGSSGVNARWISNSNTFWLAGSFGSMPSAMISSIVRRRDSSEVWATCAGGEVDGERAAAVVDAGGRGHRHVAGREGQDRDVAVGQAEQPRGPVAAGDTGEADAVGVDGEDVGAVEQRPATAHGDEQAGLGRPDRRRSRPPCRRPARRPATGSGWRRTSRRRSASSRRPGRNGWRRVSPRRPARPSWRRRCRPWAARPSRRGARSRRARGPDRRRRPPRAVPGCRRGRPRSGRPRTRRRRRRAGRRTSPAWRRCATARVRRAARASPARWRRPSRGRRTTSRRQGRCHRSSPSRRAARRPSSGRA